MLTESFCAVFSDTELRQHILRAAKHRTWNRAFREDLVQEAWLAISCMPPDKDTDFYKDVANRAIYSCYWQERKAFLLTRAPSHDTHGKQTSYKPTDNDPYFLDNGPEDRRRY